MLKKIKQLLCRHKYKHISFVTYHGYKTNFKEERLVCTKCRKEKKVRVEE